MIPAANRQTLAANIVQQACAAALLLALPNILSKAGYAETVYVTVLLSALGLADLGMSLVYGRVAPTIFDSGDKETLQRWDSTVFGFGSLSAAVLSLVIVGLYFLRFGNAIHAALLLLVPLLVFWASFHVTRVSASGDFAEYRRFAIARSLAMLTAVPLSWIAGVTGWFMGQCVASLTIVARVHSRLRQIWGPIDPGILRANIVEGVLLAVAGVAWLQLINFARLFASTGYPDDALATYGVAAAAYQALGAIVISLFLPVSQDLLRRFGREQADAFQRASSILRRIGLIGVVGAILAAEAAPYFLRLLFPSYAFDQRTVFALVLGIAFYPFFICWGNCLVGMRCAGIYVTIIGSAICLGWVIATIIDNRLSLAGAAVGQCVALSIYPAALFAAVFLSAKPEARSELVSGAITFAVTLGIAAMYSLVRFNLELAW